MIKNSVLILGARSDIAMALAHRFAKSGDDIQLAARNVDSLNVNKSDIELRYQVAVSLHEFDALDIDTHERFIDSLPKLPIIAICAVGYMGEQAENEREVISSAKVIRSNFEGPASILSVIGNRFERRGSGTIVGISSVAGERGRASNYIYGSAKAGFTAFLSGMRNRFSKKNVHVITVLPGFVATKMTDGMNLPAILTAQPHEVATALFIAVSKKKEIIYIKPIWRLIMMIIRNIPERIFKRTKL